MKTSDTEGKIVKKLTPAVVKRPEQWFDTRAYSGMDKSYRRVIYGGKFHSFMEKVAKALAYTSARAYGYFFLAYGLACALLFFGESQLQLTQTSDIRALYIGLGSAVLSVPFLLSDMPLCLLMQEAPITTFIFFDFLCLRKHYPSEQVKGLHPMWLIFFGFALAFLGFFTAVHYVLLGLIAVLLFGLSMSSPEMPFFITLLLFPLFPLLPHPTLVPAVLISLSLLSFLRKLALGNRVLHVGVYDVVLILFGGAVLLGGCLHGDVLSTENAVLYCIFIIAFPLANNLITNRRLADCALGAIAYSSMPVAIYAILQAVLGVPNGNWTDASAGLFCDRVYATFGNPNIYAVYLLIAFLFCFALLAEKKHPLKKTMYLLGTMLNGVALVCTWSRGAWIALAVAMLCALVMLWKKETGLLAALFCALPYGLFLLPNSVMERLLSAWQWSDSSIQYRFSIYRSTLAMIRDHLWLGIGVGSDNFISTFSLYAEEGVSAPHSHNLLMQVLCEGGIFALAFFLLFIVLRFVHMSTYVRFIHTSSVRFPTVFSISAWMAVLVYGIADFPFALPSMTALFFTLFGIGSATLRIAKEEYTDRKIIGDMEHSATRSSVDIKMI